MTHITMIASLQLNSPVLPQQAGGVGPVPAHEQGAAVSFTSAAVNVDVAARDARQDLGVEVHEAHAGACTYWKRTCMCCIMKR